jgi:hypothetical protein
MMPDYFREGTAEELDQQWQDLEADKQRALERIRGKVGNEKVCPTCKRPWKKLTNEQRARTNSPGATGHENVVAKSLGDMGPACKKVHELLKTHRTLAFEGRGLFDGWVSRDELSRELNGGDGARRARQLRDEFGIPIEVKMGKEKGMSRQAMYRIAR